MPVCGSPHLVYREGCPRCSSRDYGPFDGIHHISCGFTGDRRAFLRGSALICPHCNRTLEQEGRDFTSSSTGMRCGSCSFTFETPEVVAHCQHCGNDGQPNETEEQLLPQYELLPQADEAALIRRIGVADIVSSIRSQHTGLFTRQYFEYELRRELIRFKRYNVPSSILMIRIANLAGSSAPTTLSKDLISPPMFSAPSARNCAPLMCRRFGRQIFLLFCCQPRRKLALTSYARVLTLAWINLMFLRACLIQITLSQR